MKTNQAGIDLIKRWEGCKLKAYLCPAGKWTIGYGYTGPDVHVGLVWTQDQADQALVQRLSQEFEPGISRYVKVPLNPNQFSALVSFCYNVGLGAFRDSSCLAALNSGDYAGAAAALIDWCKIHGKFEDGLEDRRIAECALFTATP